MDLKTDKEARGAPTARLVVIILLVTGSLFALDTFLANTEHSELQAEAARHAAEGSRLLLLKNNEGAVDELRRAHSLERTNSRYQLALVEALVAAGKLDEAQANLDELLQKDSNNGETNLVAARLMLRRGKRASAESFYHRAIYGSWPEGETWRRISARLELADLLARLHADKDLLSELLPLESEVQNRPDLQKRIAQLYLVAGSPARAADLYHQVAHKNPSDADAFAGIGEADLDHGDYREAMTAFLDALRKRPDDASLRDRLQLSSTMTGLDPTPRKITSAEKYARSLRVLQLARGALTRCTTAPSAELEKANSMLTGTRPAHVTNESAEAALAVAEHLWQARVTACGAQTSREEEPLRLLMMKLAQ